MHVCVCAPPGGGGGGGHTRNCSSPWAWCATRPAAAPAPVVTPGLAAGCKVRVAALQDAMQDEAP